MTLFQIAPTSRVLANPVFCNAVPDAPGAVRQDGCSSADGGRGRLQVRVFFEGYGSKEGRSKLEMVNGGTFRGFAAQALAAEMRRVRRTPLCRVVLSGLCGASGRCSQKSGDALW